MQTRQWVLVLGLLATVGASLWEPPADDGVATPAARSSAAPQPLAPQAGKDPGGLQGQPAGGAQNSALPNGSVTARFAPSLGRLFVSHSWQRPAPPSTRSDPVPLPLPPLPFTYVGKVLDGTAPQVFLSVGPRTLLMRAGDVQDGYRLDAITATALVFVHLASQETQRLPFGNTP
jgi:hypothetical protein